MDQTNVQPKRGLSPWKWLLLPLMTAVILQCYLWAQPLPGFQSPITARIIFWHVPQAMVSLVWYFAACFYAVRYLAKRDLTDDTRASTAAEIGLLLTVLATVTGAIFSKMQWAGGFNTPWYEGYWQWDPKQTAIVITILIYFGYFGLRMSVEEPRKRAQLSAVYAVLGAVAVPFLYYVLPHLPGSDTAHPTTTVIRGGMDTPYRVTFWMSNLAFLGTTIWGYQLKLRLARLLERRARAAEPVTEGRTEAVRRPRGGEAGAE